MMSGSCAICARRNPVTRQQEEPSVQGNDPFAQLACIRNRYSRTFFVTTSITSSCTAALSRNVMNAAENFDNRYVEMVVAYTCRSRNVWTGRFHLRENCRIGGRGQRLDRCTIHTRKCTSSNEVEFHQSE